jgi:hypothetical protein
MHFKFSNLKDRRLILIIVLYLDKLRSTSHDVKRAYLKNVRSFGGSSGSSSNVAGLPENISAIFHIVE